MTRPRTLSFTILTTCLFAALSSRAQDIAGTWQGTLQQAPKPQRIVLKISKDAAAGWKGLAYNLDTPMAYEGRATTLMSLHGTDLRFAIAPMDSTYQGKLSDDGATITGTWTQNGTPLSLVLARATGETAWEIPQAETLMAKDADPGWDVVSIKPRDPNDPSNVQVMSTRGREVVILNRSVQGMVLFAYGLHKKQITGAPAWMDTLRWDIHGVPDIPGEPDEKHMQILIRKLLEERFGLKVHKETKELPVYAVTVAKGGHKMTRSTGDPSGPPYESETSNGGIMTMHMTNISMNEFAPGLGYFLDRPAVDQTQLPGRYDFQMKWTIDESKAPADGTAPPGMFTAIQEQIGLKLEPVKAQTQMLVIDAVQQPTVD
jgi:uncharacterized protein (TIGR03435 family)